LAQVVESIFPHLDSVGLNEQELTDLYLALGGAMGDKERVTEAGLRGRIVKNVPDVAMVCAALGFVLQRIGAMAGTRKLSRIHFHCLAFHIAAETPEARLKFSDPVPSLARGSVVATTQAAGGCTVESIRGDDIAMLCPATVVVAPGERMRITRECPIPSWEIGSVLFTLTPVFVVNKPKNTVGLGDNISAAALAFCTGSAR